MGAKYRNNSYAFLIKVDAHHGFHYAGYYKLLRRPLNEKDLSGVKQGGASSVQVSFEVGNVFRSKCGNGAWFHYA